MSYVHLFSWPCFGIRLAYSLAISWTSLDLFGNNVLWNIRRECEKTGCHHNKCYKHQNLRTNKDFITEFYKSHTQVTLIKVKKHRKLSYSNFNIFNVRDTSACTCKYSIF